MTVTDPLDVVCLHCSAEPGELCVYRRGRGLRRPSEKPHAIRVRTAERVEQLGPHPERNRP